MKFIPNSVRGVIQAPPSKSAAHRALIFAFLSGQCTVQPIAMSDDVKATANCLRALGANVEFQGDTVTVTRGELPQEAELYVGESGSTMRFFLPLVAALGVKTTFYGDGKLPERPYAVLADELIRHGAEFSVTQGMPVTVSGQLSCGEYILPGNVSSQYITGLLMALPLLQGDSRIRLQGALESKGYVELTLQMLKLCGIAVTPVADGYFVPGAQSFRARHLPVEGDYSNAAFFLVAAALAGDVTVSNLNLRSEQGDKEIIHILLDMGAYVIMFGNRVQVKQSKLHAVEIDVSQIPDLAPVLSVLLAKAEGKGKLKNAGRLRLKECDRFQAIIENLTAAGVAAEAVGDDIVIYGGTPNGGALKGFRDHRMVMSAAIMGLIAPTEVTDAEAVNKSFPNFFEKYRSLGGITVDETL